MIQSRIIRYNQRQSLSTLLLSLSLSPMYTYYSKENHTGVSIDGTVSGTCSSAMARVGALAGGG